MKPLEGITILDFSQFLSAPSATLRLADFGARVIKVERPDGGDICRTLYVSNLIIENDSSLFHSINRNKYGVSIDLKNPASRDILWSLIGKADVMVVNFRPGVVEKLGLDYASVKQHCPSMIYGEITGYGKRVHGALCLARICWSSPCPAWPGSMGTRISPRLPWDFPWRICSPASTWPKASWPHS